MSEAGGVGEGVPLLDLWFDKSSADGEGDKFLGETPEAFKS